MSDIPHDLSLDPTRVARAMRRLPFLEREALLLKTRDRMTYANIGTVLGMNAPEAEARVAAALVKVRARLARSERRWWRRWA